MEPLLLIVDELERRDEDAAAALHAIEELQREVDETRSRGGAIAEYLGKGGVFDQALAEFAVAYADQNEKDHAALRAAANDGRITVQEGL